MDGSNYQYLPSERVLIHTYKDNLWTKVVGEAALEVQPFSRGAFREAYRAKLTKSGDSTPILCVCKFALEANTPRQLYLQDVVAQVGIDLNESFIMLVYTSYLWPSTALLVNLLVILIDYVGISQAYAVKLAEEFNAHSLIHKVTFVDAFVVEFVERAGRPLAGCEAYIEGSFRKHNNNVGAVATGLDSNSPQDDGVSSSDAHDIATANAFSHFTYHHSNQQVLVCDIQGVGGTYTDPQIHTVNGKGFGIGNLGMTGIK